MTVVAFFVLWVVAALLLALALGPLLGAISTGRRSEDDERRRRDRDLARSI